MTKLTKQQSSGSGTSWEKAVGYLGAVHSTQLVWNSGRAAANESSAVTVWPATSRLGPGALINLELLAETRTAAFVQAAH